MLEAKSWPTYIAPWNIRFCFDLFFPNLWIPESSCLHWKVSAVQCHKSRSWGLGIWHKQEKADSKILLRNGETGNAFLWLIFGNLVWKSITPGVFSRESTSQKWFSQSVSPPQEESRSHQATPWALPVQEGATSFFIVHEGFLSSWLMAVYNTSPGFTLVVSAMALKCVRCLQQHPCIMCILSNRFILWGDLNLNNCS